MPSDAELCGEETVFLSGTRISTNHTKSIAYRIRKRDVICNPSTGQSEWDPTTCVNLKNKVNVHLNVHLKKSEPPVNCRQKRMKYVWGATEQQYQLNIAANAQALASWKLGLHLTSSRTSFRHLAGGARQRCAAPLQIDPLSTSSPNTRDPTSNYEFTMLVIDLWMLKNLNPPADIVTKVIRENQKFLQNFRNCTEQIMGLCAQSHCSVCRTRWNRRASKRDNLSALL